MTTMNNVEILDIADAGSMPAEESLWSRIIGQIGSMFGRMWGHMNENMGPVDGSNDYFTMGDCCS